MSNVVPLFSQEPESAPPATCGCRPGSLCYPHRLTNAADLLRAEVANVDDWLVMRSELRRITSDVLHVLDEIAGECLPDERKLR